MFFFSINLEREREREKPMYCINRNYIYFFKMYKNNKEHSI